MINSSTNNKHLLQVAYKIIILIFVLSVMTFVFITVPDSADKTLYSLILTIIIGILFFLSYKQDFINYSEEVNYSMLKNNVFASIVNTAYSAIVITDGDELSYNNKAACSLFRKSMRFLSTCKFSDLIYPDDFSKIMEYITQGIEADSIVIRINTFNNFENDFLYCQVSLKKHYFDNKEQYIVNFTDITEYFADSQYKAQTISIYENVFNILPQKLSLFDTKGRLIFMNQSAKNVSSELNFLDLIEFDINKNLLKTGFEIALSGDTFSDSRVVSRKYSGPSNRSVEEWGDMLLAPIKLDNDTNFVAYIVNNTTFLQEKIAKLDTQLSVYALEFNQTNIATLVWDTFGNFMQANNMFCQLFDMSHNTMQHFAQALTIEQIQDFFTFNEVVFIDSNKQPIAHYLHTTLTTGVQKIIDKLNSTQNFEAYICISKSSTIFQYSDYAEEAETDIEQQQQEIASPKTKTDSDYMWLQINAHHLIDITGQFYATAIDFLDITDSVDIQNKYSTSITYLKAIANNFYAGIIFIIDTSYQVVFWGCEDKLKNKVHISNDIWMRTPIHLSTMPELDKYKEHIHLSIKGSYSKITANMFDFLYDFQFFPIRNEEGEVEFCMGIGFNITDRAEFEKQLLVQKYFLDKIFAESQIPQVILDVNGKIDKANIQYYQIAGIVAEKLYETSVYDKNSWLHNEVIIKNFERSLKGETTRFEITEKRTFSMLDKMESEEYLYVLSCKSYPIFDNNNVVTHVIFNFIDISDTRMLIESMRTSNSINSIVTSNYPEGILIILDKNENFILFEGKEEIEILKLQNADILGNNINDINDISIIDIIKPQVKQVFNTSKSDIEQKINFDFSIELIQDDKFPMTLFYESNFIPVLDFNNDIEYVFICINNITNRKQLEKTILEFNLTLEQEVVQRTTELKETASNLEMYVAELQSTQNELLKAKQELSANLNRELELNQMKSQFISLMSHEFRTPLTIIQTYTYLLESYYEMQIRDKFNKGMNTILDSINMMTKLLDNILFLDKAQEQALSFDLLDVVAVIKNTINEAAELNKAEQKININSNVDSITMYTDIKMLRQIISNLISNAIRYSPKNSEINVNVIDSKQTMAFEVQDFGNGISDDVIDKIFDTFVRSQDFTNISGTGLGLAIAKNCTDNLKGDIRFETKKGQGTTFFVTLPKHSLEELMPANNNKLESDTDTTTSNQKEQILKSIDYKNLNSDDDFIISDTEIRLK